MAVGSFFNVFVSAIGALYVGLKRTKEIAITSIGAGIINFLINICLIRHLGIYAAAISTLVAFLVMTFYRVFSIKKYFWLKLDVRKILIMGAMFIFEISIFYVGNKIFNIIGTIIGVGYAIVVNYSMIKKLFYGKKLEG